MSATTPSPARVPRRDDIAFIALTVFMSMNPALLPQVALNAIVGLWLVVRLVRRGSTRRYDFQIVLPILVVALICVSVLWASNSGSSFQGAVSFVIYTVLAVHIAASVDIDRAMRGLAAGFKVILVASLAAIALAPSRAFVSAVYQSGSFQGLASHRNYMGYLACLAVLILAYQWLHRDRRRRRDFAWVALAVAVVLMTRSVTSLLMVILWGVALVIGMRLLRSASRYRGFSAFALLSLVTAGGAIAALNFGDVAEQFGRDATLTGRTDIWDVVLTYIAQAPVVGYGWNSVWAVGDVVGDGIRGRLGFPISHAHNGYLNDAVQIGWLGVALIVTSVVVAIVMLARATLRTQSSAFLGALILVLAIVSFNFVEARLTLNTGWLVFVLVSCFASSEMRALGARADSVRSSRSARRVAARTHEHARPRI